MGRKTLVKSQPSPTPEPQSRSQFYLTLTNLAVAQICQSSGFTSSSPSALRTLTSITALYLQTLSKLAANSATNSGRTQSHLFDIVAALEGLHSVKGFAGASDVFRPLLKSSLLAGIVRFVDRVDEIPFAKPIPRLKPVAIINPRSNSGKDSILKRHIPAWLPPFPDKSTYEEVSKDGDLGRSREVLFPNHVSGTETELSGIERFQERNGKRGCNEGELPEKRCKVKFKFGAKRKAGLGSDVGLSDRVCVDIELAGLRGFKYHAWKAGENQKTVKKRKRVNGKNGVLLKNLDKGIAKLKKSNSVSG